jgi:Domain of unknown function (DUF4917)
VSEIVPRMTRAIFDTSVVDDQLPSWDEVKGLFKEGSGILIGNGASQAVWEKFGYQSLYDRAQSGVEHPLSPEDKEIFKSLRTKNFELVLGALSTTSTITKILHKDETFIRARYKNIQRALVEAVHSVHVRWDIVPQETFLQIRSAILGFEFVFSTNYDLLLYWAIMAGNAREEFKDYFWGENQEFDLTDTQISGRVTRVLYLHGGLHLYRLPSGASIKRTAEPGKSVLDLFGVPFRDDATPLFITEGTSEDKLASIRRSDYLSFAYSCFSRHESPIVVFGHSLSGTDSHLVRAMKQWALVNVAISLRKDDPMKIVQRKATLRNLLPNTKLLFFDAATHPLGKDELRVTE